MVTASSLEDILVKSAVINPVHHLRRKSKVIAELSARSSHVSHVDRGGDHTENVATEMQPSW